MSINIIQKAFTANRKESVSRHDGSPVKTVLGNILLLNIPMIKSWNNLYSLLVQEVWILLLQQLMDLLQIGMEFPSRALRQIYFLVEQCNFKCEGKNLIKNSNLIRTQKSTHKAEMGKHFHRPNPEQSLSTKVPNSIEEVPFRLLDSFGLNIYKPLLQF